MKFSEVYKVLKSENLINEVTSTKDFVISGIENDSRKVKKGYLYFAIKGYTTDGHSYIESALNNGAKLVVCETIPPNIKGDITFISVKNSRIAQAVISDLYYESPTQKMKIIGVTGTNGKTSTTYILESILKKSGLKTGIIGTIGYKIGDEITELDNTTPDSIELFGILKKMNDENVDVVIMEVSSHALELYRVYKIQFDMAIFTNLTQDHLDFHKDMNDYFNAKKKLFTLYLKNSNKKDKKSLINTDDKFGKTLFKEINSTDRYSLSLSDKNADFFISKYLLKIDGTEIETAGKLNIKIKTRLVGGYNLYNILTSVAIAKLLNIDDKNIENSLKDIKQIPGRLQQVEDKPVFIDYAHTPDAIEKATKTLKELTAGKLITIIGAGGDRDKTKRPLMSLAAVKNSDFVILTSDNPRTEDPEKIIDDLETPLLKTKSQNKYTRITNRAIAIKRAIEMLKEGDTLLICGKGHEDYQIIGNKKHHFSDYEEVVKNYS